MKKKYYGNYLGIVISGADEDPEARGRCQIFIPHVSNTLFTNWNEKLKDIEFSHYTDDVFTPDVIKRLKVSLPWSEYASPVFGGSSGAFYNRFTGTVGRDVVDTLPSDVPVPTEDISDKSNKEIPASNNIDSNPSSETNSANTGENLSKLALDRQAYFQKELQDNPQLYDRLSFLANREVGSNALSQQSFMETVANRAMFSGTSLSKVLSNTGYFGENKYQTSVTTIKSKTAADNVFKYGSNLTNLATDNASNDYKNNNLVAQRRINAGLTGQWMSNGNVVGYDKGELLYRGSSDPKNPYYSPAGAKATKYALDNNIELGTNPAKPDDLYADNPTPQAGHQTDIENNNPNPSLGGSGSAKGMYTFPSAGAKVWVFFNGGEIQSPVYFAAAPEPETIRTALNAISNGDGTYSSANIGSSDGTSFSDQVYLGANGAGIKMSSMDSYSSVATKEASIEVQAGSGVKVDKKSATIKNSTGTSVFEVGQTIATNATKQVTNIVGESFQTFGEGLTLLIGTHDKKTIDSDEAIYKEVKKIEDQKIKEIKSGKGQMVECPNCAQKYTKDRSDFVNRIVRTLSKLMNYLPFNCFNWPIVQFFMKSIVIPMLSEISGLVASGGKGCGACKNGMIESAQMPVEQANKNAAASFEKAQDTINSHAKNIKSGTGVIKSIGPIALVAGHRKNDSPCFAIRENGDTIPVKLKKGENAASDMSYAALSNKINTVVTSDPIKTNGELLIDSSNDIVLNAGTPGIKMLTGGTLKIETGSVEITSSPGSISIGSTNLTTIKGDKVLIEAQKAGLSVMADNTLFQGAVYATGDAEIKGSFTAGEAIACKHLIIPTMRTESTVSSSSKACTNSATWYLEGAAGVNAYDKVVNMLMRNLKPSWILTPSAWMTLITETYDSAMLNCVFEPCPIGIAMTAWGPAPVIGFTHTHQMVPQDHTHFSTAPKMTSCSDVTTWGQVRPNTSNIATPAPGQGTEYSPGPRSLGSCGGGGFGFGSSNSRASLNRELRNSNYGLDPNTTDYSNIFPNGKWKYDEFGEIIPKPKFTLSDDC